MLPLHCCALDFQLSHRQRATPLEAIVDQPRAAATPQVRVRFLDLSVTDKAERNSIMAAVGAVLDHGRVILGPEVQDLERRIAHYCGRRHAIGVGSGTDALILGLKALA